MSKAAIAVLGLAGAGLYQLNKLQRAKEAKEAAEIMEKEKVDREARAEEVAKHFEANPRQSFRTANTANQVNEGKLRVIDALLRQLSKRAEKLNGSAKRLLPAPVLGQSEPPEFLATFALILLGEPQWFERILQRPWKNKVAFGLETPGNSAIDLAVADKLGFVLASLSPPSVRLLMRWLEELSSCSTKPSKMFHGLPFSGGSSADYSFGDRVNKMPPLDGLDLLDEQSYKKIVLLLAQSTLDPSKAGNAALHEMKLNKAHPPQHAGRHAIDEFIKQLTKLRGALRQLGLYAYPIACVHSPGSATAGGVQFQIYAVDVR